MNGFYVSINKGETIYTTSEANKVPDLIYQAKLHFKANMKHLEYGTIINGKKKAIVKY